MGALEGAIDEAPGPPSRAAHDEGRRVMPDFAQMTAAHFIYIPFALLIGLIAGYMLGARAVRAELEKKRRRMKE